MIEPSTKNMPMNDDSQVRRFVDSLIGIEFGTPVVGRVVTEQVEDRLKLGEPQG